MPFTLSGLTITQTGTDTSLAGLNGIAGVTRIPNGDGVIYSMPTLALNINGILTIADPIRETMVVFALRVLASGNYTSGTFCADGITPKTNGVHFMSVGVTAQFPRSVNTGALEVQSGGSMRLIGGSYSVSGGITYLSGAANIEEIEVSAYCAKTFGVSSGRVYYGTPNVSKTRCKHYDLGVDLFVMPSAGRPFEIKAFNSEYTAQYVGSAFGGVDSKLVLSDPYNQDGTYDFDNYSAGWVEIYNSARGALLNVVTQSGDSKHCVPLFQDINFSVSDLSGQHQENVRFMSKDASVSNAPTFTITTVGGLKTWDFRSQQTYQGTTNASGVASSTPVLQVYHSAANLRNLRFPNSTAVYRFCGYSLKQRDFPVVLGRGSAIQSNVAMVKISFLTLPEAQALALTGISFVASGPSGGVVTITQPRTVAEIWQAYRAWISQFANFGSNDTWSYDGSVLQMGEWTLTGVSNVVGKFVSANFNSSLEVIGSSLNRAYATTADRANNVNPLAVWTGVLPFGFAAPYNGLIYLSCDIGFTAFRDITLVVGTNVIDFGLVGALASIQATMAKESTLALRPSLTQIEASTVLAKEVTIASRASQASVDGKPSLTQIEASTILAKEATIASRASQASVDGKPSLTQIEASTVLAKEVTIASRASQTSVDGKPSLTQIEASTILAKEATVASRASQVSVNNIPTNPVLATDGRLSNLNAPVSSCLQSSAYVPPDNASISEIKTRVNSLSNFSDTALQAKLDTIKAKTDLLTFTGANLHTIAKSVEDKTGYTLTAADRAAIVVAVEQAILDESDGRAILNAIVAAIGNTNVSSIALTAAILAGIKPSLDVINTGVMDASLKIPHSQDLPS